MTGSPARAHGVDQLVERGEVGLRRRARVGAQHAQHPAQLGERRRGRCRPPSAIACPAPLGPRREHLLRGLGLHGDHAHVVGDDVVQVAGDAHPLVGRGPLHGLVAVRDEPARPAPAGARTMSPTTHAVIPTK